MTKSDLQQDALQDMASDKDSGGGCGERGGGSRRDTVLPPVDSSLTPISAEGAPSTESTLQYMEQRFLEHERNDLDSGDRTLDDGAYQFTVDTLRNFDDEDVEDSNTLPKPPMLTKNGTIEHSVAPHRLKGACRNSTPPQNAPVETHKDFHYADYDGGFAVGLEGYHRDGCLEKHANFSMMPKNWRTKMMARLLSNGWGSKFLSIRVVPKSPKTHSDTGIESRWTVPVFSFTTTRQ